MERKYLKRIVDEILKDRLEAKGAVLLTGTKWCGKTTSAKRISKSFISIDRPDKIKEYKNIAEINPSLLLEGETPRLIDEWQIIPSIWNTVRYVVDERGEFNQFILTGSATPPELDETYHTGIGRIARLKMRTLSLYESLESNGQVSLSSLFKGENIKGVDETSLKEIAFRICRGGWPMAIGQTEKVALRQAIDFYDLLVSEDISRINGVKRDKERTIRVLRSYARHVGTDAKLETIRRDILSNDVDTFEQNTLYSYLATLKDSFVIEDTKAWNPNIRSSSSIRKTDTRYFSDPSIAAASLGVGPNDLINDLNTFGLLFENLCMRDLKVYADYLEGDVYHYRDSSNLECDAVVHLKNGEYGLIEIKLGGETAIEQGATNLKKLSKKIDTTRMKAPSFMMVLCAVSNFSYMRKDGIYVVSISCLKP